MSAQDPRALALLDDYVAGELDDVAAARFEEAFFEAAAGGDPDGAATFTDRVAQLARHLMQRGTFHFGITLAELEALRASGLRVQVIELGRPGRIRLAARIDADADLVVSVAEVGDLGVSRVDTEMEIPSLGVTKTIRDVKVGGDGRIYGACERELATLAYGSGRAITRVIATRDGRREVVAEFDVTLA